MNNKFKGWTFKNMNNSDIILVSNFLMSFIIAFSLKKLWNNDYRLNI